MWVYISFQNSETDTLKLEENRSLCWRWRLDIVISLQPQATHKSTWERFPRNCTFVMKSESPLIERMLAFKSTGLFAYLESLDPAHVIGLLLYPELEVKLQASPTTRLQYMMQTLTMNFYFLPPFVLLKLNSRYNFKCTLYFGPALTNVSKFHTWGTPLEADNHCSS